MRYELTDGDLLDPAAEVSGLGVAHDLTASATMAATSSAAMGWNRPGEILTMFPSAPLGLPIDERLHQRVNSLRLLG